MAQIGARLGTRAGAVVEHGIELLPENPDFSVIRVPPDSDFSLEGVAVGLIRNTMLM